MAPQAAFLLLAAFLVAPCSAQESRPVGSLRVGGTIHETLRADDAVLAGHGPSKAFEFVADTDGPVTVCLESFDFDASLRVERGNGDLVAEDDNGAVETNARVVFQAKPGSRYRIVAAAAKEKGAGEYILSLLAGDVARPTGAALLDTAIAFRAKAA